MTPFHKEAGVQHAFQVLHFSSTEKQAFLAAAAKGLMPLGKSILSAGKGLWGIGSKAVGATTNALATPIRAAGSAATNFVGKNLGASQGAINKFKGVVGHGVGKDMASFGLLSGGIGAATAEPGDRLGAFGRGFATGAVGGAVYKGVANAARVPTFKALGAPGYKNMSALGNKGIIKAPDLAGTGIANQAAQRAKRLGAKALIGGVPMAAGTVASFAAPTFNGAPAAAAPAMYPAVNAMAPYTGG